MKTDIHSSLRPEPVLSCWKEIAGYLRRDVRTVQRWERSRGLPVHRLPGKGKNAVYALIPELDAWWVSAPPAAEDALVAPPRVASHRQRVRAALLTGAAFTALAVTVWLLLQRPAAPPPPLAAELLTSLPGAELYPTLSPDGSRLLYAWSPPGEIGCHLYLIDLPMGKPERLTAGPGLNLFPEWSPLGNKVVYIRVMVGAPTLEVRHIDVESRLDRLLFVEPLIAVNPPAWAVAWTRLGDGLILSESRPNQQTLGLTLHHISSGARTRLTTPEQTGYWDTLPAVSPDGQSLVFLRRKLGGDGNLFRQELRTPGLPEGPARQITREPCCVDSPSWSADGSEVLFLSRRGGIQRLMRVDARGGPARHDPSILAPGFAPRVARNGWLVTWDMAADNKVLQVPLLAGVSAGPARELIASSRRDTAPAFSADGKFIAFSSNRSGAWQLWVCRSDGSAARPLTELDGIHPFFPAWSPNGKWIAWEGRLGEVAAVYVADATTGKYWGVTAQGITARLPRWSRNGSSLYVASDRTGRNETWLIDLDANGQAAHTRQVTRNGGFSGIESPDGRFLYYSKHETLKSIWRLPVAGGREEEVLGDFAFNRYPSNLAAGPGGLYFRGQRGEEGPRGQPIWMLPFTGGPPRKVMDELSPPSQGIAISPDGRLLLLSTVSYQTGDVSAYKTFK